MFLAELEQMEIYLKNGNSNTNNPEEDYTYSHSEDISQTIWAKTVKSLLNRVSERLVFKRNLSAFVFESETVDEETGNTIVIVKAEYYIWRPRVFYTPEQQKRLPSKGFPEYATISFKVWHNKRGITKEEVLRYISM